MNKRTKKAYESTTVSAAKSRGQIGALLEDARVSSVQWTDVGNGDERTAMLRFVWTFEGADYVVRLQIVSANEKERKRLHRNLFWYLKSCFEAVDSGIAHMGQLFLPFLETSSGLTVSEQILPRLRELENQTPFALLPGMKS